MTARTIELEVIAALRHHGIDVSHEARCDDLGDDALARLDEIWPGPGGEAPQTYAW